jgi:hypothetical protein
MALLVVGIIIGLIITGLVMVLFAALDRLDKQGKDTKKK